MRSADTAYLLFFSLLAGLSACKDIIEPSLKNRVVTAQAPGDQFQSASYTINFWWDTVDDALRYRLQVVTPDFVNVGGLLLDTLVTGNRFTTNLPPGAYQWRFRAENGSSQTAYSTAKSFTIVASSIKQQSVQLIAPANNLLTNQSTVLLQWGNLYGASKYLLQIDTNNFADENVLVYNQAIPVMAYTFAFPKEKSFQWRVRAQNDTAQAQWSVVRTLTYDHTPPAQVSLLSPANDQLSSLPVNLQWSAVAAAAKYKLYVFKGDSTTAYGAGFPMVLNGNSYSLSTGSSGEKVYWKVSAIDAVGNEGVASAQRSFTLK